MNSVMCCISTYQQSQPSDIDLGDGLIADGDAMRCDKEMLYLSDLVKGNGVKRGVL